MMAEMPVFKVLVGGVLVTADGLRPHADRLTPRLIESLEARGGRAVFTSVDAAVTFMGAMLRAFTDQEVSIVGSWENRERRVRARGSVINEEEVADADRGLVDAVEEASHVSQEEAGRVRPPASLVRQVGRP
jgi:hypothetical protein